MQFRISQHSHGFFISLKNEGQDNIVAKFLDISVELYREILKKHNPKIPSSGAFKDEFFFENESDAEEAVRELEPYLIMLNLVEE